eukprot:81010-Chlamydomonas_euryale.AAC.2
MPAFNTPPPPTGLPCFFWTCLPQPLSTTPPPFPPPPGSSGAIWQLCRDGSLQPPPRDDVYPTPVEPAAGVRAHARGVSFHPAWRGRQDCAAAGGEPGAPQV